jgi:putative ABC transport system permease protein
MQLLWTDLWVTVRRLVRTPAYPLTAIAVLALGIGANTTMFSLLHSVLLSPLPYASPQALVGFEAVNQPRGIRQVSLSVADFRDFNQSSKSFKALAAYRPNFFNYAPVGEPAKQLAGGLVTPDFLKVFGVNPVRGRGFSPTDFSSGAPPVVILSHSAWRRMFGARDDIIGHTVLLNDEQREVIGVMPPSFQEPAFADCWVPFPEEAGEYFARDSRFWTVIGRLGDGVTIGQAQAELTDIARQLEQQYGETNKDWGVRLTPLLELRISGVRRSLAMLMAAVALVLAIACLNLANLSLVRGTTRLPEMGLRLALGARPADLARQMLGESVVLAVAGGAVGCGVLASVLPAIVRIVPSTLLPRAHEVAVSLPVVAFALLTSVLTGLCFGALPAWQLARTSVSDVLKQGGGRSGSASGGRLQAVLVGGQIALTLMVLTGAVLLLRSFWRLQAADAGFRPEGVSSLRVAPAPSRYETNADLARYYDRLLDALQAVPGIDQVAIDASAPLTGITLPFPVWFFGRERRDGDAATAVYNPVSERFFSLLQIPLMRGRLFSDRDGVDSAPVAVVNQAFARRYFPGEDPIGRRILLLPWISNQYREIVGVVGDVRQDSVAEALPAEVYVPQKQMPWIFTTLLVRFRPGMQVPLPQIRDALQRIEPTLPVELTSLAASRRHLTVQPLFYAILLGGFAAVALVLAGLGVYSSMAFLVAQRTREIGIRLALGSTPAGVVRHFLRRFGGSVVIGAACGLLGAWLLTGVLRGLLYGIAPRDFLTLLLPALVLPALALTACAMPAWRAARRPPLAALQSQ